MPISGQWSCGKKRRTGNGGKRSPELATWIQEHVSFPGTMVDRIAPAATKSDWLKSAAAGRCRSSRNQLRTVYPVGD
ncbi:hypothetical protein ACNKHK_14370 [Shigella flexneri]